VVVIVVVSGSEVIVVRGGAMVVVLVSGFLGTNTANFNTRDRVTTKSTKTINAIQMILARG
jgi:hypothetical protein